MTFTRVLTVLLVLSVCASAPAVRANMAPPPDFTLGLSLEKTDDGPRVKSIDKGGVAAEAGVQVGDLILGIDQRYAKLMSDEDLKAFAEDPHTWPIELIIARGENITALRLVR